LNRFGPNISLFAFVISAAAAPFVFLGTSIAALIGMVFWGVGMSAQVLFFKPCSPCYSAPENEARHLGCLIPDTGSRGLSAAQSWDCFMTNQFSRSRCFQSAFKLAALPLFFIGEQTAVNFFMDPYAKPKDGKVGAGRPKIRPRAASHRATNTARTPGGEEAR